MQQRRKPFFDRVERLYAGPSGAGSSVAEASAAPRLEARLTSGAGEPRSWAVVLRGGDEVMSGLKDFLAKEGVKGGHLSGIGAFSSAELAFFDRSKLEYIPIPIPDQVECLSLNGTVGIIEDGEPMLHVHCTLGYMDGSMKGGHVLKAVVWPTLEVFLTESKGVLPKAKDPESTLELFTFGG